QQFLRDDQVTGGRDREKLGAPFDETKKDRILHVQLCDGRFTPGGEMRPRVGAQGAHKECDEEDAESLLHERSVPVSGGPRQNNSLESRGDNTNFQVETAAGARAS